VHEQAPGTCAGIGLDWQIHELEQDRHREGSHPQQEHRFTPERLHHYERAAGQDKEPGRIAPEARQGHQAIAESQERVARGLLEGMARFVGGTAEGDERLAIVHVGTQAQYSVARIIVVCQDVFAWLDSHAGYTGKL